MLFFIFLFFISISQSTELETITITDDYFKNDFSERLNQHPVTITKPKSLQLTSPKFEDLFNEITTIQSRSEGSPTTSIRGSNQAGRVLFLIDHIPLNFLDGFGGSPLFIPNEILGKIRVAEGPTSSSYGGPAMAGAIHFIPEISKTSRLRIGLSDTDDSILPWKNNKLSTSNISLTSPLLHTEKDKIQASGFFENDRGDFPYEDNHGSKKYRKNNRSHNRRFTIYGRHKREQWRWSELFIFSHQNKTTPGPINSPLTTQQKRDAGLAAISSKYNFNPHMIWGSHASYSFLKSQAVDNNSNVIESEQWWVNQNINYELIEGWLWRTGLDWNHNTFRTTYSSNELLRLSTLDINQSLVIPLTSTITLEPSYKRMLRFKKSIFSATLNKELNVYQGHGNIWLMYSEGYRPPSLSDLHASYQNFISNPNLKPENSRQYELGMTWSQKGFNLKSSLFYVRYTDFVQTLRLSGVQTTKTNVGQAQSSGFNNTIGFNYNPWSISASHSLSNAKDKSTNKRLNFVPKQQLFMKISYSGDSWKLTAQQRWWSEIQDTDFLTSQDVLLDQWASTDILLDMAMAKRSVLSLGIYNLWDRRRELNLGYPEPQRRYALALEYKF